MTELEEQTEINENKENSINKKKKDHKNTLRAKRRKKIVLVCLLVVLFLIAVALLLISYFTVPIVELEGENTEIITVGSEYNDRGIHAYTLFRNLNSKVIVEDNIDTLKLGDQTVTYKVPYLNGYKEYTRTVRIIDNVPPELSLEGNIDLTWSFGKEFEEPGYKAVDNYDGDISNKVEVLKNEIDENNYEIHYSIVDSSGNKSELVRHITIVDDTAPKITLNGNNVVSVITGNKYEEKGAKATDDKDGDLTNKIKISGNVDSSKEGTYKITYEVSDSSGNVGKAERTIIVNKIQNTGVIYLTFDDGPSSTTTPKILDILKEKGVHATFFILNYSNNNEYLVKRELQEGHSVGIHGYSHNYADIYTSVDTCYENITKLQEKIRKSTGRDTKIVRFPGGSSNTISKNYCPGIMTAITKKILSEGYRYYDWNVASGDSGDVHTKEAVYDNVTKGLKHGRNNVVLMHDFSGNDKTVEALPEIIDYGIQNGYKFDVITTETPMVTHNINN